MDDIKSQLTETLNKLSQSKSYKLAYLPLHGKPMPSIKILAEIVNLLRKVLFPGYFGNSSVTSICVGHYMGVNFDRAYQLLAEQIRRGLCFACEHESEDSCVNCKDIAPGITAKFMAKLPEIRKELSADVKAAYDGDPAAKSFGEIIYCYPTIRVLTNYRIAHQLLELNVPLIPRIIAEMAHSETGIDIHPGAKIGESFTIDHGTGVVIGETCIIGNNVKIYQGVTLGAKSFPLDDDGNPIKGIDRHPIVEDNVVIYAEATILGRITIGEKSVIGGNVWITQDVKPESVVTQRKPSGLSFTDGAGI